MVSERVQVHDRYVLPADALDVGLVEYRSKKVRTMFADELLNRLTPNGGIVGPIHETQSVEDNYTFWSGAEKVVSHSVYARVADLPEPEMYRLVGGPADGVIVRTGGVRTWLVPVLAPLSAYRPFDGPSSLVEPQAAEYERQGDTQVYLYRRMAR